MPRGFTVRRLKGTAARPGNTPSTMKSALFFVTGAARSGKSRFAARLAAEGPQPVTFLATGVPTDPEMARRIAVHRAERPAGWRTLEEPRDALGALRVAEAEGGTLLLDCLGFLIANWMEELGAGTDFDAGTDPAEAEIAARVAALAAAARDSRARVIVVSNEVGWGLVPAHPSGRLFRDLLGRANQTMVSHAGRAWLVVAGLAVELKASGLGRSVDAGVEGA